VFFLLKNKRKLFESFSFSRGPLKDFDKAEFSKDPGKISLD
jgi:hypothetical protein